ncbi:MAG: hypothetical protein JWQ25_234 [Daejeonella sp.]|nr:hypothetical protein [Daejeonella sp.]
MKRNINFKNAAFIVAAAFTIGSYIGCQPDEAGDGNGLSDPNVNATFTVTPVEGKTNTYVLKSNTSGVLAVKWDKGDGSGFTKGKLIDTVFYPDAGKYTIVLNAVGKGGIIGTSNADVTVATSDPIAGNLVVGGKMEAADDAKWQRLPIGNGVDFTLSGGKMVAAGGGWGHKGIYQAIDVVAGKKYKVDMLVSGGGAINTWFEVYVGTAVPVAGKDYADGGKRLALSTWAGCGNASFNGKLSAISCDAPAGNTVQFATTGKVYLVIRTGGEYLGANGISIDNVEFRGTK